MSRVIKIKALKDQLAELELNFKPVENEYKVLRHEILTLKDEIETEIGLMDTEIRNGDKSVFFDGYYEYGMKVSCRKLPASVVVDDVSELPEKFIKIKQEADKRAIKSVLYGGEEVTGAKLSEEEYVLKVDYAD